MAKHLVLAFLVVCVPVAIAQEPDPRLLKSATIQWVADGPPLVYDIRFAGGDSTTMPTALKYLVKDLAAGDGWYLTGEDKSKTVASQAKRISLEYTKAKSKVAAVRVTKVDVKEGDGVVGCAVAFTKKPAADDVKRTEEILETFTRKYMKLTKSVRMTIESAAAAKGNIWSFDASFKAPAKEKK